MIINCNQIKTPNVDPTWIMNEQTETNEADGSTLQRGWTTGACATAATKAALTALITGDFPDPVAIVLPKGDVPHFPLAMESLGEGYAIASIIKDAGDDPDVTHGAMITVTVQPLPPESGIVFKAGAGVGTVTKSGLPVKKGEPAINPVPRKMMTEIVNELCDEHQLPADVQITISIPDGENIAQQTWNPRLGIIGGLSILGTTGVVHPFSCSAWIHSIHRGIDVARAEGLEHVMGATGSTSEKTARELYNLPEVACLDMGDFAGGLLKYIRAHPVPKLTICGGFAKMVKLAQGALDLHSARSQVDMNFLADLIEPQALNQNLKEEILNANTALEAYEKTQENDIDITDKIARKAYETARNTLRSAPIELDVIIVDRQGSILAQADNTTAL